MKKNLTIFALWIFFGHFAYAQLKPPVAIPSPNAANLGMYGQIPVNYFNGLPSIEIPIHAISEHGINLPISLSYHASGVRPDHHPGWVGLGWSLKAGGVITRSVNGEPDEKVLDDTINRRSYLINYSALNVPNWTDSAVLRPILNDLHPNKVLTAKNSPSPDEFIFNFNEYSGSFFLDHTGTWKLRSTNGKNIKVSLTTNSFLLPGSPGQIDLPLARIIDKIQLTTPDGTIYTFGGTQASIEFSRNPGQHDANNNSVIPTSWFLTNIKQTNGEEIVLNYERGGYAIINSDVWRNISMWDIGQTSGSGSYISETLINPVYLKEIVTSNQTLTFHRALTNELTFKRNTAHAFTNDEHPANVYRDIGSEGSKWYKLTSVVLKDNFNNKDIKKFEFDYKDEPTSRLMLLSVQEKDPTNLLAKNPHKFFYYKSPNFDLPEYTSRRLDHWGFFNNVNFFESKPPNYLYKPIDEPDYIASRESDTTYLKEGSLSHILYPTGGQTEFVYEANAYSYIAYSYDVTPYFDVRALGNFGNKKNAGGLRIKKIISRSNTSAENVREFIYTKSDTYATSTGILGGRPKYVEPYYGLNSDFCVDLNLCTTSTANYWYFTNNTVAPLSYTQGSHVTYTEVKEKFSDGGYKIYKYSNHDNPAYRNISADNSGHTNIGTVINVPYTDMSYSRGKLLSEETYTASSKLLQKVTREYNSDPNRFNDAIRMVAPSYTTTITGSFFGAQITAYKIYLFEPYLQKVTTQNYNQEDNNYVQEVSTYTYNGDLQLKSENTLRSDGTQLAAYYRYPIDKTSLSTSFTSADLLVVDDMISKNIVGPLLEKDIHANGAFLKRESTVYGKYTFGANSLLLPSKSITRNANASADNLQIKFDEYDQLGNIKSYSRINSPKTSFMWGYNKTVPIAKVSNANPNEFFFQGFEEETSIAAGTARTGNKSYNGSYQIPFTRPNSKKYLLSYWKLEAGKWELQQQEYTTDNMVLNATVPIDDITIAPVGALLQTYTYTPLVGMTSETSANHISSFYDYDLLSRLVAVKDYNKHIVRSYEYKYANTDDNWVNTGNSECEQLEDEEYYGALYHTGNTLFEQVDKNPFSFTFNKKRKVIDPNSSLVCPPSYYYATETDPSLTSLTIRAKRSYSDGTNKTMKFRVRYDDLYTGQEVWQYVDIAISVTTGNSGSTTIGAAAGSYLYAELIEVI